MFVWTVLSFFWTLTEGRRKKEHLCLLDLSASPQVKTPHRYSNASGAWQQSMQSGRAWEEGRKKEAFRIFHPILMMTSERRDDKCAASKVGAIKLQCVKDASSAISSTEVLASGSQVAFKHRAETNVVPVVVLRYFNICYSYTKIERQSKKELSRYRYLSKRGSRSRGRRIVYIRSRYILTIQNCVYQK